MIARCGRVARGGAKPNRRSGVARPPAPCNAAGARRRPVTMRARRGSAKGGQNRLFRRQARLGSVIGMCFGVPGPQGGRRCAGDDDVSPAMANRRPLGPNESRRGQRGQHGGGKGRGRAPGRSQTDATCPTCGGLPGLAGVSDAGAVAGRATVVVRRARQVTQRGQSRLARPNETASRTTTIHL